MPRPRPTLHTARPMKRSGTAGVWPRKTRLPLEAGMVLSLGQFPVGKRYFVVLRERKLDGWVVEEHHEDEVAHEVSWMSDDNIRGTVREVLMVRPENLC